MALRWGTNLPGPFFVSWGRTPRRARSAREMSAGATVVYVFWQMLLWTTVGVLWFTWVCIMLVIIGIRVLVGAVRDSRRRSGRHDARATTSVSEPIAHWSDRR